MTAVRETTEFPGSSNLASASYDPETQELTIEFVDGSRYLYHGVPPAKYRGLGLAGSAGAYFHRQIKSLHDYEQV